MVWTGTVIAQWLGAVTPHEDGASVPDLADIALGIGQRQLEMLGRDEITHLGCLIEVATDDQRTAHTQRGLYDLAPLHVRQQPVDALLELTDLLVVRREPRRGAIQRFLCPIGLAQLEVGE